MFQFPWFASCTYVFSTRYSACAEWVPPFRDLWITVCLPTPQSFSQATTSFIASDCQGIHRIVTGKQKGYRDWEDEFKQSMREDEILDWVQNNMDWEDVEKSATKVVVS